MMQNQMVEAHRRKAEKLRRELFAVEAELRGMEMILGSVSPAMTDSNQVEYVERRQAAPYNRTRETGRVGGKQPGSLSQRWRAVLNELYSTNDWFDDQTVVEYVELLEDRKMKLTEVRRLFAGYEQYGYIERREDGAYSVTDQAAQRFGFHKNMGNSPDENEALNGHAASASEADISGADTPLMSVLTPTHPTGTTS